MGTSLSDTGMAATYNSIGDTNHSTVLLSLEQQARPFWQSSPSPLTLRSTLVLGQQISETDVRPSLSPLGLSLR